MQATNNILKYKVLLGLHAGAEVALPPGEYIIGSHIDCDIVLNEEDVAPFHFKLRIKEDFIEIIPKDGEIYVQGKRIDTNAQPLNLLEPFKIGKCICCIGKIEEENWPDPFESLQFQKNLIEKGEEKLEQERGEEEDIDDDQKIVEKQHMESPQKEIKGLSHSNLKRTIFALGIIIFLFFLGVPYFLSTTSEHQEKNGKKESLEEFLKKNKVFNLKIEKNLYGTKIIGIVKDINTKMELASQIKSKFPDIIVNIMSKDEIFMAIRNILESYHAKGVNFYIKEDGVLLLDGFAKSQVIINKIIKAIHQDMNNILKIKNNVLIGEELKPKILQTFLAHKIKGKINLQFNPLGVKIEALISKENRVNFGKVVEFLKRKYANRLKIASKVSYLEDKIKFDVKGVYIGTVKYLVWANGKKYFQGSTLPCGFVLKKIDFNKIELEKGAVNLSISTGGN